MEGLLRNCLQYISVRRLKKAVIVVLGMAFILLVWRKMLQRPRLESAISCKSKIAGIAFPKIKEKEKYISSFSQHDVITMEEEYYHFVNTLTRNCYTMIHIGPQDDGGWEICLDPQFDIKPPCLVYSFGIGNDFRFEKGIEDLLKCEVHAFDPSMGIGPHQYSDHGFFYDLGIDGADTMANGGRWKMRRLKTIMRQLGHEGRTIDYLKMDVEFSEWLALVDMVRSGVVDSVRQMALEVHTPEMDLHRRPEHKCTWSTPETISFMVKTLFDLHRAGFSMYYSRTNHRTPYTSPYSGKRRHCCHDIHLVNTRHKANRHREGNRRPLPVD